MSERGSPFKVQLVISAPQDIRFDLANVVKAMVDGFVTALHYYHPCGKPDQLDEVANQIARLLRRQVDEVRKLLLDDTNAVIGGCRVPHIRDADHAMMWSPDDHLLVRGEIIRETCQGSDLSVSGRLYK